ncbi:MAG: hypothetical protein V1663_01905 [archaeon]
MIKKQSQISVEYIALISFVILIVMAIYLTSYSYANSTKDTVLINQVDKIANTIMDNAESVYNLGYPSKTTIKIYIPENIKSITISSNQITFIVYTTSQEIEIFKESSIDLEGSLSTVQGLHEVIIESTGDGVLIRE